jgi:hypothetical protein
MGKTIQSLTDKDNIGNATRIMNLQRLTNMQDHKGSEWSDTVVNTMRSGLLSRLNKLGLVRREKNGKYIRYHITDVGKKYIQSMSKKD